MFDVFYSGTKPNLFAHEQAVDTIEQAQQQSRTRFFWFVNYLSDYTHFDFLWEPTPWQAYQRHAWPSQHQPDSGTYLVPKTGYADTNYHTAPTIHCLPDMACWNIPDWIDPASIDPRWSPDPMEPPYVYEFPVEWGWDNIGGPQYCVPGASEIKYVYDFVAKTRHNPLLWYQHYDVEWSDEIYRWRPIPTDPPYIYVFGNQWYPAEIMPTVEYRVPGATERKYMDMGVFLPKTHSDRWSILHDCNWDYSWVPDPGDPPYIYVFGNQWHTAEIMPTIEYAVPGATERKYMNEPIAELPENPNRPWYNVVESDMDYSWVPDPGDPPYIYVFGNQWHAAEIMPTVEYRMPGATERKYVDVPVAKLVVDMKLWHVPDNVDITDMDFSWVPDPGSPPYIYQFATQHQKTGGPQYCMLGATEIKYVDMMQAEVTAEAVCIVEIDHLDGNAGLIPNTFKRIRYFDNYRDTLIRLAKSLVGTHEHVWVCSSVCDYTDFDFSWHPEKWQSTMLHVFPSNSQKFGDTFYMHVPTFAERAEKKQLLEWYSVNYVSRRPVPRRPMPVIQHHNDSHVDAVKSSSWAGPLATFTNTDYVTGDLVTVPLWRAETKTIVPLSPGASSVVVPRAAVGHVQTQLYDYAYIDRTHRMLKDEPLDIVFISNGEPVANETFAHLQNVTGNLFREQRIHHVKGINGRVAAYHAAAEASSTPWFFAVFAKLFVDEKFNWDWQPDRMQQPKHYIFHALNPVNGLEYGHQAMIAYNRQLVLNNAGHGLDFTLDDEHEVVPILSGTAVYNMSPWVAWRTAFREALKLKSSLPDVENEFRLTQWLSTNPGSQHIVNEEWSRWGAEDAVEYYNEVDGDFAALKKSYEWAWLASYAFIKRSLVPDL
jgi:hypothetical protein